MEQTIAVIAEHEGGSIARASYEALGCATEIQRIVPAKIVVVVMGDLAGDVGREIASLTHASVVAVHVHGLHSYDGDAYRSVLADMLLELHAAWICVPGTTQGLDFAPGLAVRLGASCVSAVENVLEQAGRPVFVRPLFNGKIVAEVAASIPTVVLVQPGSFPEELGERERMGSLEERSIAWQPTRSRVLGLKTQEPADAALSEAAVIVAAGRGMGRKEHLEAVQRVAGLFARSAVAGSRPLCDQGWLPYRQQVGQTGASVSPDLYLACGISGAPQHLIGMRGSKFVVAVNTDPEAAIFRHADIGIVEDAETFLSELSHQTEGPSGS